MIEITEELIDQLEEKYYKLSRCHTDEEFIKYMKNNFIGFHIDEKEALKFFKACYDFYWDAYEEGYRNG